jgi:hypothetical protein
MMLNHWCAMFLISGFSFWSTTPQQSRSIPLVVEQTETIGSQLSVRLRNVGSRTIIAWGVRAHVTFADGAVREVAVSRDGYEAAALAVNGLAGGSPVLTAGARYTQTVEPPRLRNSVAAIVAVSAQPILAIFDDDTAVGEESHVSYLFRARALNQRVWQLVERVLTEETERAPDALTALRAAEAALEAVQDNEIRMSSAYFEFRRTLAMGLDPRFKKNPDQLVPQFLKDAGARRAAAEARSERQK